jgi:hypothetical protein
LAVSLVSSVVLYPLLPWLLGRLALSGAGVYAVIQSATSLALVVGFLGLCRDRDAQRTARAGEQPYPLIAG